MVTTSAYRVDVKVASDGWLRPTSVADAVTATAVPNALLLAGGCELGVRLRQGAISRGDIIMLDEIAGLDRLVAHPKIGLTIGAAVRLQAIVNQIWIAKRWAALHEAVEQLIPPQIRNMSTVVGNICTGRSDCDLATALMALRATVRVVHADGAEVLVALEHFYDADGRIGLDPGLFVREIFVPPPSPDAGSAFRKVKFGAVTVLVSASIALDADGQRIEQATLVIGGCLSTPRHSPDAESLLCGAAASTAVFEEAGRASLGVLAGVRDHAPAAKLVAVLARDALEQAASRARSKHNPFDDAQHLL